MCVLLCPAMVALLLAVVASAEDPQITVHLVPHSHDDVGWLKTPEQYQYGLNDTIQRAHVDLIYDSVISELRRSPARKFVAVEMFFFTSWYDRQAPLRQEEVKLLVASGQLGFAGGGWVMHDEACTLWQDMADQMTLGHDALRARLNVTPRVGWQIDPFGHSSAHATLFSQNAGFHSTFHSRIDYTDFVRKQRRQSREYMWEPLGRRPSTSRGDAVEWPRVFSGQMLHATYCPPAALNFDVVASEDTAQTPPVLEELERALEAIGRSDAAVTRGSHVMVTMGCDFAYVQAAAWFQSMDRLIERVNHKKGSVLRLRYSTPEEYAVAKADETVQRRDGASSDAFDEGHILRSAPNLTWPILHGDSLPYADAPSAVWTGFFTSRASLKRSTRITSSLCRSLRVAAAARPVTSSGEDVAHAVSACRDALAVVAHHDGITGTSRQHVAAAYQRRLSNAAELAVPLIGQLTSGTPTVRACLLANESRCPATSDWSGLTDLIVLAVNPDESREAVLEIPLPDLNGRRLAVLAKSDATVIHGWTVLSSPPCSGVPGCLPQLLRVSLLLPGHFATTLIISVLRATRATAAPSSRESDIQFSADGRWVTGVRDAKGGKSWPLNVSFCLLRPATGTTRQPQAAGAYISRPTSWTRSQTQPLCIPASTDPVYPTPWRTVAAKQGNGVQTAVYEQQIAEFIYTRVSRHNDGSLEWQYVLDSLPTTIGSSRAGVEVAIQLRSPSVDAAGKFWSDSNGLGMVHRVQGKRVDFSLPPETLVRDRGDIASRNLVPITSHVALQSTDGQRTMSLFVDRATAAGIVGPDSDVLTTVLQRRLLHDDARGVAEPLNETEFIEPYNECLARDWAASLCGTSGQGVRRCGEHYGHGLRTEGRFAVAFSSGSSSSLRPRILWAQTPIIPLYSSVQALNDSIPPSLWTLPSTFPKTLRLASAERRPDYPAVIRVRVVHDGGIDQAGPTSLDVADMVPGERPLCDPSIPCETIWLDLLSSSTTRVRDMWDAPACVCVVPTSLTFSQLLRDARRDANMVLEALRPTEPVATSDRIPRGDSRAFELFGAV